MPVHLQRWLRPSLVLGGRSATLKVMFAFTVSPQRGLRDYVARRNGPYLGTSRSNGIVLGDCIFNAESVIRCIVLALST